MGPPHPRHSSQAVLLLPSLMQNLQFSGRFDGVDADPNFPNAPAADARPGRGSSDAPRCGASPSPCPGEAQGVWGGRGTKGGTEGPSQGCSGERNHLILLWDPLGAAPGWSQPSSEQPLGFCGGLKLRSDSPEPIQALGQSFSPAGKGQAPLKAQPGRKALQGLPLKNPSPTKTILIY